MTYCSYDARKVLECLDPYGIEMRDADMLDIERSIWKFYTNHVTQVVEKVLHGGNTEAKLGKIELYGWDYFAKPVESLLGPRTAAHRADTVLFPEGDWVASIYRMATTGFCLADFSLKELYHLVVDIPPMVSDALAFSNARQACRENRSIYYLHGVLRRDYQTAQGKVREIQKAQAASETRGWTPPNGFEKMDVMDRRALANDWQERLNNIKIAESLNAKIIP